MSDIALLIIDMRLVDFSEFSPEYKEDELPARVKSLIAEARSAQTQIVYAQNNGGTGDLDKYACMHVHVFAPSASNTGCYKMSERLLPDRCGA